MPFRRRAATRWRRLSQLSRRAPAVVENIRDYKRIIAFRNILIHGYAAVDDEIVWRVVADSLPLLLQDAERLRKNLDDATPPASTPTH